jgi:hypothetical protein
VLTSLPVLLWPERMDGGEDCAALALSAPESVVILRSEQRALTSITNGNRQLFSVPLVFLLARKMVLVFM